MPARIMVTGSRERFWTDPQKVKHGIVARLSTYPTDTLVMQGGADGVDQWTQEACEITGHDCLTYVPYTHLPSPQRFHERNDRMLADADEVLAVWDGESRGTASVIEKARKRGIRLWVWRPGNQSVATLGGKP